MSKFWSENLNRLKPYVPGEQPQDQQYIKLNTNENPYPPSPGVLSSLSKCANERLRLYPDPNCSLLKKSISKYYDINTNQVFVGNGSDEVLAFCFEAFFKHQQPVLFPDITYSFYPVYCSLYEIEYRKIPLNNTLDIELSAYPNTNAGIIFPNPNAPTGKAVSLEDIKNLLDRNTNTVVIIDEAYVDFGATSAISLTNQYPNLLVTQTFSKSRSLAGLRSGFAVGNSELIEGLERVKNSFNSYPLDNFAIKGSIAALEDEKYFSETCSKIIKTRENTKTALEKIGFTVLDSKANFLFISHPQHQAERLYKQLKREGILVRYFNKERIDNYLRVTIGHDDDMNTFLITLERLLSSKAG